MHALQVDPSLRLLLKFQARAKFAAFVRRVRAPRRMMLTFIAFLLGTVWIGQAIFGLLFRPSADPDHLITWIPLGLASYAIWHVLKTTFRKPVEPFDWTPTETEFLGAAPLRREQLVAYRLTSVGLSASVKALLFSVVMFPDLPVWPLGFAGMFVALVLLDLLRMTLEVAAWGCKPSTLRRSRLALAAIVAACVVSALTIAKTSPFQTPSLLPALSLIIHFVSSLISLQETFPGYLIVLPFRSIATVIMANGSISALLLNGVSVALAVGGMAWLLIASDRYFIRKRQQREVAIFPQLLNTSKLATTELIESATSRVKIPKATYGVGTIFWRQWLGMLHYGPSILFAMIVPGFFSLIPLFAKTVPIDTVIQVAGGLIFYSFLLMPSALRFDFRRDIDRMAVLKALPIRPIAMTIGQLTAPVIACTSFQLIVLAIAWLFEPYSLTTYLLCVALLVPINVVIFALENLIFMYFPYRPNQEGIAVFIRSILTFTAKGAIFCAALALMLAWIHVAGKVSGLAIPLNAIESINESTRTLAILWSGIWLLLCAISSVLIILVARTYNRFDPSQDTPPMG